MNSKQTLQFSLVLLCAGNAAHSMDMATFLRHAHDFAKHTNTGIIGGVLLAGGIGYKTITSVIDRQNAHTLARKEQQEKFKLARQQRELTEGLKLQNQNKQEAVGNLLADICDTIARMYGTTSGGKDLTKDNTKSLVQFAKARGWSIGQLFDERNKLYSLLATLKANENLSSEQIVRRDNALKQLEELDPHFAHPSLHSLKKAEDDEIRESVQLHQQKMASLKERDKVEIAKLTAERDLNVRLKEIADQEAKQRAEQAQREAKKQAERDEAINKIINRVESAVAHVETLTASTKDASVACGKFMNDAAKNLADINTSSANLQKSSQAIDQRWTTLLEQQKETAAKKDAADKADREAHNKAVQATVAAVHDKAVATFNTGVTQVATTLNAGLTKLNEKVDEHGKAMTDAAHKMNQSGTEIAAHVKTLQDLAPVLKQTVADSAASAKRAAESALVSATSADHAAEEASQARKHARSSHAVITAATKDAGIVTTA
jgi:hypothetical protein